MSAEQTAAVPGRRRGVAVLAAATALHVTGAVLTLIADEPLALSSYPAMLFYAFCVVGAVIAYRRPGNRIAWLCLAIGLAWALEHALWGVILHGLAGDGPVAPYEVLAVFAAHLWVPGIFMMLTYLLMLFPDGHLPSRRWRWLPWATGVTLVAVYGHSLLGPELTTYGKPAIANRLVTYSPATAERMDVVAFLLLILCVVASAVSLVVRYRRSVGVERQQLRWLVAGGVVVTALYLPAIWLEEYFGEVVPLVAAVSFVLIPMAIGIAIVRYRLYDIDRVISRTLAYTIVVAALAVVYAAGVFVLGRLLPLEGEVAVAGSTLVVAALFNPLRRHVQRRVDRRFNRSRYDAQQVMEQFEMTLRDRVDPDAVTGGWQQVVSETMQPVAMSAWVRVGAAERP